MKVFIGNYKNEYTSEREVNIKIDDYDTWSVHNTLSLIIEPLLEKFSSNLHGAPFVDDEDVPEELRSTSGTPLTQEQKDNGSVDDNHFKRWDYVLKEMIHAFKCDNDPNWEDQFYSGEVDFDWESIEDGKYFQMIKGPNHTFEVNTEAESNAWDRRKNGLRLFAKYYHHLWD